MGIQREIVVHSFLNSSLINFWSKHGAKIRVSNYLKTSTGLKDLNALDDRGVFAVVKDDVQMTHVDYNVLVDIAEWMYKLVMKNSGVCL